MSYAGSGGEDQSEDGELRHSPSDAKSRQEELLDFSLSEEDVDTADSLDIKPPQASRVPRTSSRTKRRERRDGRTRHTRTERHREDRTHGHREKHHRERVRPRPEYHREYKELYRYTEGHSSTSAQLLGKYVDVQYAQNIRYERKFEDKKHERYEKELRYQQEIDKTRRYEEKDRRLKSVADQTLDDLRERLLDKKRLKDAEVYTKHSEKDRRRLKLQEIDSLVEQDADMYVKEIIDLSEDRKDKKKEDREDEKKVLDPESEEHELRKEKLLQAVPVKNEDLWILEREMSRQKEQYKLDRERRHQRRQERQEAKRRIQEEQQKEERRKRQRMSGEMGIVTVSDTSTHSSKSSLHSRGSSTERTSSSEEENEELERSEAETSSGDEKPNLENLQEAKEETEESDEERVKEEEEYEKSPESLQLAKSDRSSSRSRSKSPILKSNGQVKAEEKPKSPSPKKIDEDLPPYFPAIQGCRSVEEFQCLNRIEEGTYGVVYRARDKRTEEIVALKTS